MITITDKEIKKALLLLGLMLLSLAVDASSTKINGINYNLNSSNNTAEVAYGGYSGNLVIPSLVTKGEVDYTVTSIASNAFYNCPKLISITIPKSVTTIATRREFFYNNKKLNSIIVEEGNPNYDSRENCNALIETASNKLLYGCNGSFIPDGVTTIGEAAFSKCAELTSLVIPNSVTTIEDGAFSGCSGLTSVYIGTGLEHIGEYIFNECDNLKTTEINSNALVSKNYSSEEINAGGLFWGAPVEEVILGEEVRSIGDYAFAGCGMLSIKMFDNVTKIGDCAFQQCLSLTSVELSNNLTYIGKWAFTMCFNLLSITIPQSVRCIDQIAFYWCDKLTKVVINSNEVVARENEQFYTLRSCFGPQVKEFVFGEDVRKIAYIACSESEKLTTVTIPANVTCVEDSAFYKCTSITDIYFYAEQVPETDKDVFADSNYKNATLHVPANAVEAYSNAEQWKDFGSIVALTDNDTKLTGIQSINNEVITAERYYSLDGKQTTTPQRGLNIIRMSDGTTKKVILK